MIVSKSLSKTNYESVRRITTMTDCNRAFSTIRHKMIFSKITDKSSLKQYNQSRLAEKLFDRASL